MRVLILTLVCLAFNPFYSFNKRDYERKFERAQNLYTNGNYSDALRMYLEIFKNDSTNCNLCYKIGACYLKTEHEQKKALRFLKKAAASVSSAYDAESAKERNAPVKVYKLLADAYHANYEFDAAISFYEKFLKTPTQERDISKEIKRRIDMCNTGKILFANPIDVKITNLGNHINSPYPDYAPKVTADQHTMIYTSKRPENMGGKTYDGGQYFEDIYVSVKKDGKWQKGESIGSPVNTVGNEAAVAISTDGQEILIYKDDMGDGNIYSTQLDGDKWSVPRKLNAHINSKHWEPAACISADGNSIYFVSDRPGGFGGSDIYKSTRTPRGEWGRAVNLGPAINSAFDEHTPFIHPDGVTLYFSSKGHKSMGGFDIFYCRFSSEQKSWSEPNNIGYPINTTGDDAFYILSPDKSMAYYSSAAAGGLGEKDNYQIYFPTVKEPAPLALIRGQVRDTANVPKNVQITVADNQTGQVLGVYQSNSKTGEYSFILEKGKSHNIAYEADGHMFCSACEYSGGQSYDEKEKQVKLSPLKPGASTTLNNIFFDFDDSKLKPASVTELDRVYNFMLKYPSLKVEVDGYADSKGTDEYNRKLSKARAQSVVDYLVKKGIAADRLVPAGRGENQPAADNTGIKPSDRKVELRVVKM